MTFEELADACEAADGPDRSLDGAIAHAVGTTMPDDPAGWPPRYTGSLDAAVSLVPESYGFKGEHNLGYKTSFTVGHVGANRMYDRPDAWAQGSTPALALCAAALRAHAAPSPSP